MTLAGSFRQGRFRVEYLYRQVTPVQQAARARAANRMVAQRMECFGARIARCFAPGCGVSGWGDRWKSQNPAVHGMCLKMIGISTAQMSTYSRSSWFGSYTRSRRFHRLGTTAVSSAALSFQKWPTQAQKPKGTQRRIVIVGSVKSASTTSGNVSNGRSWKPDWLQRGTYA
jgi:hypothetical protein